MKKIFLVLLFLLSAPAMAKGASFLDVAINEIAWMGTKANGPDEWIELYNNTDQAISLDDWGLYEAGGGTLIEPLSGTIEANSYYLIERTDDTTVSDISASQTPSGWGGSGLKNDGEHLQLLDQNSTVIDEVNCSSGWFAGEASPNYITMERKNTQSSGSDPNNWAKNNGSIINGKDAEGNPVNGTPKAKNSVGEEVFFQPTPSPTPEISPTPTPTLTLLPTPSPTPLLTPSPTPTPVQLPQPTSTPEPKITYPSGIIINEILPAPSGPDETEEWIEIFNQNNFEADLSGWQITDTVGKSVTYTFPTGTKVSARGFLVLSRPTTKITLNNDEDGLSLFQPNRNILDSVNYQKAPQGQSYNRSGSEWVWSPILTPGSKNILTQPEIKKEAEKKSETEAQKLKDSLEKENQLAAIGTQAQKPSESLFIFLIAFGLAIFSGIIILILKRKF